MSSSKILIIEDNPDDALVIDRLLRKAGYKELIFCVTGGEGVRRAREESPDIVIVDTMLPDQNGFEVCNSLRGIPGNSFRIILTTGVVDAVDAARAREAGADDYVVKTSDFALLLDAVKQAL